MTYLRNIGLWLRGFLTLGSLAYKPRWNAWRAMAVCIAAAVMQIANAAELRVAGGAAIADVRHLTEAGPAIEVGIDHQVDHGAWRATVAWVGEQDVTTSGAIHQRGTIGDYWLAGAQGVYQHQVGRVRLEAGAGLAWRTEARNVHYLLPSRLNFSLTLGLRRGRATIEVRHISNGWTRDGNKGQNWLQVGIAF